MEISITAWHYPLYVYSHCREYGWTRPEQVGLCSYWGDVLIGAPIILLVMTIAYVLDGFIFVLCNLFIVPTGFGFMGVDKKRFTLWRYNHVPINGRAYPVWLFVCSGWLLIFCAVFAHQVTQHFTDDVQFVRKAARVFLTIVALAIAPTAAPIAYVMFSRSDMGKPLRAYLKARKDGICPMVTFVDPNASNDKECPETESSAT